MRLLIDSLIYIFSNLDMILRSNNRILNFFGLWILKSTSVTQTKFVKLDVESIDWNKEDTMYLSHGILGIGEGRLKWYVYIHQSNSCDAYGVYKFYIGVRYNLFSSVICSCPWCSRLSLWRLWIFVFVLSAIRMSSWRRWWCCWIRERRCEVWEWVSVWVGVCWGGV